MSLQARAIIAITFLVAFFALALAAAAGLAVGGVKLFGLIHHMRGRGILLVVLGGAGCLAAAGVILWSLWPRVDHYELPGPELTRRDAPELFRAIDELAAAAQQEPPAHVYLLPNVN